MNFLRFWYRTTIWLYLFSVFLVFADSNPAYLYLYVINTLPIIFITEKYTRLGISVVECRVILANTARYTKIFIAALTLALLVG